MTRHPFPWIALVAYGVYWAAPWINRWLDQPPRPPRPAPAPPVRWVLRRGPGQELERRDGS